MQPHHIFRKSLWGLLQSVSFDLIAWQFWMIIGSHLTFNQSTELLILGFIPLCLKTLIIQHSKKLYGFGSDHMHYWRMAIDCYTLVYDQVKLSWFKVIEWCQGSVDPDETWWHGLIPKEFIQQRSHLDSKGILMSLHERLTLDVQV